MGEVEYITTLRLINIFSHLSQFLFDVIPFQFHGENATRNLVRRCESGDGGVTTDKGGIPRHVLISIGGCKLNRGEH